MNFRERYYIIRPDMIRIHEVKLKTGVSTEKLLAKAENKMKVPRGTLSAVKIARESLDAREKPIIYRVYSLDLISEKSDEWLAEACNKAKVRFDSVNEQKFEIPWVKQDIPRPVVVGFGPCGMFSALILAKAGAKPIVLERGSSMEKRINAVEGFWEGGKLNFSTNVQFGEGGAGTFSDGKLTTGTKSPYSRFILESFVDAGASPKILYKQKPHIGSDVLRNVVVNIRKEIETLGGEILFDTKLESINIRNNQILSVNVSNSKAPESASSFSEELQSTIPANTVILGTGHSARDTVRNLYSQGLAMEQKPFSMGVRIEHPQELIDKAQFAASHEELGIGAADYKLNVKTKDGRGVYTFCMCPGGYVINASSHEGCVVTNGMSNANRDAKTANSALLCDIRTTDYESADPLAGIAFQEKYEHLAFIAGGVNYSLPREKLGQFMEGSSLMDKCLPSFVCNSLREAVPMLGKKLKGFDSTDALLYGIESRSSSPVRIKRDAESLQALASDESIIKGLYPAGEGAGYAGGIMSAAADGIKAAMSFLASLQE